MAQLAQRAQPRLPKYCLHKRSGHAFVKLGGRQVWLGRHGTPESHERYLRALAEFQATGRARGRAPAPTGPTVDDLVRAYLAHCEVYYRRADGSPTGETQNVTHATRPLLELYRSLPAHELGITQLRAVRERMIESRLARTTINARMARIRRLLRWAAEEERVPAHVWQTACALRPLARARSRAREPEPRRPVTEVEMRAVLPHLGPGLRALVEVLWWTGMRVGEAVQLRGRDVDTTGPTWVFDPPRAKGRHRGKDCRVDLGPQAQRVLRPFVKLDPDRYWFSPREEEARRQRARRAARRTPRWPSHEKARVPERKRARRRPPGERYDSRAVARAIRRACRRAGIPPWSPHQLRHAALTRIRQEHGIEAAVAVGGHASAAMTQHYTSLARRALARQAMLESG